MRVLDSDHCVAVLRGELNLAEHVAPEEELAVTAITVGELIHAARRSARPQENLDGVRRLVGAVQLLAFDHEAAEQFGNLKAALETKGTPVPDMDLLIASIALVHGGTLITHNTRHFRRIEGLALEDWL